MHCTHQALHQHLCMLWPRRLLPGHPQVPARTSTADGDAKAATLAERAASKSAGDRDSTGTVLYVFIRLTVKPRCSRPSCTHRRPFSGKCPLSHRIMYHDYQASRPSSLLHRAQTLEGTSHSMHHQGLKQWHLASCSTWILGCKQYLQGCCQPWLRQGIGQSSHGQAAAQLRDDQHWPAPHCTIRQCIWQQAMCSRDQQ